jgi:hypothetical protein
METEEGATAATAEALIEQAQGQHKTPCDGVGASASFVEPTIQLGISS